MHREPCMNNKNRYTNRYLIRRCLLSLLSVIGILGSTKPAEANVEAVRHDLEIRVLAMRAVVHGAKETDSAAEPVQKLVQWYNWPNWGNWGNWPNWFNYR